MKSKDAGVTLRQNVMIAERHNGLPTRDILAATDQIANWRRTVEKVNNQVDDMIATNSRLETGPRGRLKAVE